MVPAPLALHQVVSVSTGGEVVIRLMGYDLDGDDLVATITSVPDSGTLHQVSRRTSQYLAFAKELCANTAVDGLSETKAHISEVRTCSTCDATPDNCIRGWT